MKDEFISICPFVVSGQYLPSYNRRWTIVVCMCVYVCLERGNYVHQCIDWLYTAAAKQTKIAAHVCDQRVQMRACTFM